MQNILVKAKINSNLKTNLFSKSFDGKTEETIQRIRIEIVWNPTKLCHFIIQDWNNGLRQNSTQNEIKNPDKQFVFLVWHGISILQMDFHYIVFIFLCEPNT